MLGKKKEKESITTFLCPLTNIEGRIEFEGTIRLDGKVKGYIGNVEGGEGTVIVGEKAKIEADMNVDSAIIMGEVKGSIFARKKIEVYPPASITGDMNAPVVSIDSGAVFNGKCTTSSRTILSDSKSNIEEKVKKATSFFSINKKDEKLDNSSKK